MFGCFQCRLRLHTLRHGGMLTKDVCRTVMIHPRKNKPRMADMSSREGIAVLKPASCQI